ncbi:MAG: glycosyl hydrolase [Nitrospirota bacterium]
MLFFIRTVVLSAALSILSPVFIICESTGQDTGFKLGVALEHAGDLSKFEKNIGRRTDIFLWYQSLSESLDTANLKPIAETGRIIQLAWEPQDYCGEPARVGCEPLNQPHYRLKNITAGNLDADIRRWARELRDFGYPVWFRPMSEMNGDWTLWSGTANGNSPEDYIPAWRHIYDIFIQEGVVNVKWVWSPNCDVSLKDAQNTFATYYPGDGYVDYIGIDGYNWGRLYSTAEWTSSWQDIEEIITYSYDVVAVNTTKPIIISETASTEVGGNKAQWVTNTLTKLPIRFPRVIALIWFNYNKETDWRLESSAESLEAFRKAIKKF